MITGQTVLLWNAWLDCGTGTVEGLCVIKPDTSLSLFAFQEKEAEDVYCFGHVLYEMFSGEPLRTSTLHDLPAHCPSQLSKYCIGNMEIS